MLAIRFYDAVVALHVMAIIIAFGVVFTYPLATPYIAKHHTASLAAWHGLQAKIGQRIIAPVGGIALLLGAYLATDADVWDQVWVTVPLVILIVLLGVGGAYLGPREQRLSELGKDPSAPEYQALSKTVLTVQSAFAVLVLVAVFFMVTKLGA